MGPPPGGSRERPPSSFASDSRGASLGEVVASHGGKGPPTHNRLSCLVGREVPSTLEVSRWSTAQLSDCKTGRKVLRRDESNKQSMGHRASHRKDENFERRPSRVAGERHLLRPLGGFEYFMARAHRLGCGVIYFVADVTGPVTVGLVAEAATLCVKRHPNLRARLFSGGVLEDRPFHDYPQPIHVPLVTDRTALRVAEDLLSEVFVGPEDDGEQPLWRLVLVQDSHRQQQQLVCLAHHSVLDGDSVTLFLQEIVEYMQRLSTCESEQECVALFDSIQPLPFTPSQDVLLRRLIKHVGSLAKGLRHGVRRMHWLAQRPVTPDPEACTADVSQRRSRIISAQLAPHDARLLLQRCKAEGTTVTGALASAVMLELKALLPRSTTACLKVETMVNLRQLLVEQEPSLADSLGLFAAPIDMVVPVSDRDELWAKARAYKRQLSQAMARQQWYQQIRAFRGFGRFQDAVYHMLGRMATGPSQGRVKAAAISNLGRLDGHRVKACGEFGLTRLQWGISEHGIGHYVFVGASSQGESLNVTVTVPVPIVSEQRGWALLRGVLARLTEPSRAGSDATLAEGKAKAPAEARAAAAVGQGSGGSKGGLVPEQEGGPGPQAG